MIYNVTDNRITINDYFFEMDTEHKIYVYGKNMKLIDTIVIGNSLTFEQFKQQCTNWIS